MALVKAVPDVTGADFAYWRITDVRIFPTGMRAVVTLSGYVSAETRRAGMAASGYTFGFDLAITDAKLPGPVSADTGLGMYFAMATVFYELIKAEINTPPAEGEAPHPLAGAIDG